MIDKYYVILAMKKFGGSFVKSLAEAFRTADEKNFQKLKNCFPEYWSEYEKIAKLESFKTEHGFVFINPDF